MDTRKTPAGDAGEKKIRPRFHAAFWNFLDTTGVRWNYFGGSVGLGAGGFAAPAPGPGLGVAGFAAPVEGGAATPDCTL